MTLVVPDALVVLPAGEGLQQRVARKLGMYVGLGVGGGVGECDLNTHYGRGIVNGIHNMVGYVQHVLTSSPIPIPNTQGVCY